ncbi:Copper-exporting P-type ATPase B [Metallosphaera sp. J1]|uniref:plasma-membrane proton-efflux P-type ATPase n=1 Tax=Metallosphaera javensis (ex Hofmann et al. 2022) TaxID=99938 RepID=UPI001EE0E3FA|nr:plasma-membrane proton-efflux P-type ATPase [Metallosphaera javensis (ex Hofmann et al. 2022)]MCG3109939.1 Copper-exporting P-type ATPase B [Metallosphaera javensis (ex Hofmann et al. 2022)]
MNDNETLETLLKSLNTTLDGLTSEEAKSRLLKFGPNEVKEKRRSPVIEFLMKFWAPVPWMLEVTVILTFLLQKFLDMYIILFLLIFNSIISFVQEHRAENAVELLKRRLQVMAKVKRDGKWVSIQAKELVPGDLVTVRIGDIVPADIKIVEGEILVDQSALTGESQPVERKPLDNLYSGSIVKRGEAKGIVISTGARTYFGKTTQLVQVARAKSHIQDIIMKIVRYLIVIDVILVIALTLFAIIAGIRLSDVLPFSLVVLIASVPVALPATFTIAMALGAEELSRKGILVTRLNASEDAASMDVLNLDKTGTLTENRLRVGDPIPSKGYSDKDVVVYALLASDEATQDPIDLAVAECSRERGISSPYSRLRFEPFDPSKKRTEAIISTPEGEIRVMKGAPQVIEQLANVDKKWFDEQVSSLSARGFRVIAVAAGREKLEVVGLLPLYDRPRPDSPKFIQEIKNLGVAPKMVTGDNSLIAVEVAREVGIGDKVCDMREVREVSPQERSKYVEECQVFAEVFPEDKYTIVKSLQDTGHVVGMTGDGVNDAPALKQAEVGIAVYNSTDVAKASASMVLTHEGLTDIVEAIKTGRKIYQRMLTYTMNKIIKTLQVVLFLTLSFFLTRFFVTTPFDVILLLFLNDFVTMSIATDNVTYSMKPERWNVNKIVRSSLILALLVLVESFFVLWFSMSLKLDVNEIHTAIFDMLVFTGQFTIYILRTRGRMWSSVPSKPLLISSIADILFVLAISSLGILVTPIPIQVTLAVLFMAFTFNLLFDQIKVSLLRLT